MPSCRSELEKTALQVLENGYSRVLNAYTNTTKMEWGGGEERGIIIH